MWEVLASNAILKSNKEEDIPWSLVGLVDIHSHFSHMIILIDVVK